MASGNDSRGPALNYILWTIQVLLAALFLFAGAMKFVMPVAEMTKQMPLPAWFLWFIGVAEILGGLGLILPSLLRIKPGLTPLAAAGLVIIMIGAVVVSAQTGGLKATPVPLLTGLLSAFVAYGRWRLWPIVAKG
ncbi:MAG TPA: DoxX family protein [Thermoanaerobaculia bacterium]|jgi:uncharacterized membrane protein YphA (DoxX/SURF4 family)|nr:DoxX family protein [Thermoanaerobaculia bacterium]